MSSYHAESHFSSSSSSSQHQVFGNNNDIHQHIYDRRFPESEWDIQLGTLQQHYFQFKPGNDLEHDP